MRVRYRGTAHVLQAGEVRMPRGEVVEIPRRLYDRLVADPTVRLEVIREPRANKAKGQPDGPAGDTEPAAGAGAEVSTDG